MLGREHYRNVPKIPPPSSALFEHSGEAATRNEGKWQHGGSVYVRLVQHRGGAGPVQCRIDVELRCCCFDLQPAVHEVCVLHNPAPISPCRQQYLECEHAQMVFGEGGARAVSYPVWKLCALLPLPRFAGLHPRLVAHIGLLASLWLPRDGSTLVNFFEDAVELLQVWVIRKMLEIMYVRSATLLVNFSCA